MERVMMTGGNFIFSYHQYWFRRYAFKMFCSPTSPSPIEVSPDYQALVPNPNHYRRDCIINSHIKTKVCVYYISNLHFDLTILKAVSCLGSCCWLTLALIFCEGSSLWSVTSSCGWPCCSPGWSHSSLLQCQGLCTHMFTRAWVPTGFMIFVQHSQPERAGLSS